ncbi:hypothetical protein [Caulobacter sp. Root1472]|uniref:hypothetical protein n=1 Tax=Caulobacter sp. Root1472 TaxID=1736470 RepID=UPI0006F8E844|nr:hypothetical protein [Caulobacter sp. Root1472]KQZ28334.1 hypothetical protein ASD47_22130 [Caulobacter sp. Root1472]
MIRSAADAQARVKASFYPPMGERSNGPVRAATYGGRTPDQDIANSEILTLPQIANPRGGRRPGGHSRRSGGQRRLYRAQ